MGLWSAMPDYLILMHRDVEGAEAGWPGYLAKLGATGRFQGGSSIGAGASFRKSGTPLPVSDSIVGFLRVEADDLAGAEAMLAGNPVYEAGGTCEIRLLPEGE
jgi:hypothetical protein